MSRPTGPLRIRDAGPEDREAVAALVGRLNAAPETRCTAWGEAPEEVLSDLAELEETPGHMVLLAEGESGPAGVVGFDWDPAAGRGWCVGPWAAGGSGTVAAGLLDALLARTPANLTRLDTTADAGNTAAHALYLSRGFREVKRSQVLVAPRPAGPPGGLDPGPDLEPGEEEAFGALHREAFPDASRRAETLLGYRGPDCRILVTREGGMPVGYLVAEIHAAPPEGFVLYLGVARAARRRGLGRALLRRALAWFFEGRGLPAAALVVDDLNVHARKLYEDVGFAPFRETVVTRREFPEG